MCKMAEQWIGCLDVLLRQYLFQLFLLGILCHLLSNLSLILLLCSLLSLLI